jgi:methyl-accepting chemotaxis protein
VLRKSKVRRESEMRSKKQMGWSMSLSQNLGTGFGSLMLLMVTIAIATNLDLQTQNLVDVVTTLSLFGLLVGACLAWYMIRSARRMREMVTVAMALAKGDFSHKIDTGLDDELGQLARGLQAALDERRLADQERRSRELQMAPLQTAIEGATTGILIIDREFTVSYVNRATMNLLFKHEAAIQGIASGFSANSIVGTCIDIFHSNPAYQRRLLDDPMNFPRSATVEVGPAVFQFHVTAIHDAEGTYIGNCLEWVDCTDQIDAEFQLQGLIEGATDGQLDRRIDTSRYEGFLKGLAPRINKLLDAIVEPIQKLDEVVSALEQGDLTRQLGGEFRGVFATLQSSMNTSLERFSDMVRRIGDASDAVAAGSSQIVSGTRALTGRIEQEVSSLQETAASVEELTTTVRQTADNARHASQLAAGARDHAVTGGEVVANAVTAMSKISESSRKISEIISVIDEIAFQTNLLALNAAVEAARAGEQGRGFAVVASEVRSLAQRSATAAKEIKRLINDSVERVVDGSRLVNDSGATLTEIVNAVKKVSDIIAEISAASQEQAAGIEKVNQAVNEMDSLTQQNAHAVGEAAAAASSMDNQSKNLAELMGFFKLAPRAEEGIPRVRSTPSTPLRTPVPEASSAVGVEDDDDVWEEF